MDNKPNPQPGKDAKQPKYSIVTYLVILFAVVIALVLLSYVVQRSRESSDLDSFRSEHVTRMDQLEMQVDELEGRVAELEGRVEELMEITGNTGE